jgi:DNA-binding response OmpR family regulator
MRHDLSESLSGRRVLVVEDEFLVSLLLEDQLTQLGCEVVRTAASLAEGLSAAANDEIDLAVLDVNLNGERSFPIAAALRERDTPFIFATGFGRAGIEPTFADAPVLQKPYSEHQLRRALIEALDGQG